MIQPFNKYIMENIDLEKALLAIDNSKQGAISTARKKCKMCPVILMEDNGIFSIYKLNNNFDKMKKILSKLEGVSKDVKFVELRI